MFENIGNRLPMDLLGRNLDGRISSSSRHVRHDAVAMATQRRIEHSAVMGIWRPNAREPIFMKFDTQQQIKTSMTVA